MKPAPFTYHRPESRAEVDEVLAAHGGEAKLLAGGQSLVPMLNFRLATPEHVVDVNHLRDEPREPAEDDGSVTFGPLVRQDVAESSPLVTSHLPLAAEALGYVAHPAIRSRGTVVGSIAHADPAAELPAVLVALGGWVAARSRRGRRTIAAGDLYTGLFETALGEDEWIEEVRIPALGRGQGCAFEEYAQRRGDYGLCGVAARAELRSGGVSVSLAYLGMGPVPVSAELEEMPARDVPEIRLEEAVAGAVARLDDPPGDVHATAGFRRMLARKLGVRAARRALQVARARS
ncbi:MAG: FAD binding domain-containing protein [Actinomycetota bacterium]